MLKSFVMRLMHMGRESYVVGETITPNYGPGDLLVVGSASGETSSSRRSPRRPGSSAAGARDHRLARIHNHSDRGRHDVVRAPSKDQSDSQFSSVQPMASLFEQGVLLLGDSFVLALMERATRGGEEMFTRHANLE
jgi:6-phospho-3-hexuloisomerase